MTQQKNHVPSMAERTANKIIEFIIPPIGAVGIMDNARIVLELLTTNDKDRANQIIKYLFSLKRTNPLNYI